MKIPLYQVDAFTSKTFGGNPAAVCLFEKWPEDSILQNIAAENNLSETAFLIKNDQGYDIRWFTPTMEIDLCGHATLASAHVLFHHLNYKKEIIHFNTIHHGTLIVSKFNNLLTMEFPASQPKKIKIPIELIQGLGKAPLEVYATRDIMAVFEKEEDILQLYPDFNKLKELPQLGVIVTSRGNNSDFVSRFFAPNAGIDEDPVTGSAHTTLIPYWSQKLNMNKLHAFQISKRIGELFCEFKGDKVLISGRAITYLEGKITI